MTIESNIAAHIERVFDSYRALGRESADAIFIHVAGIEISGSAVVQLEEIALKEFQEGVVHVMTAAGFEDTTEVRNLLVETARAAFVQRLGVLVQSQRFRMSNVVDLATRRRDCVVIETGICGADDDPHLIGRRLFWLEYRPAEGGYLITWSGTSLAEARSAASEWLAEGTLVSDRTGMP